jgi:hypothetical protein
VYEFFARYVRKVYSDSDIMTVLKNNEGLSFVDKITLSDIVLVISVIKNGHDVWDQNIKMKQLGAAVHGDKEEKKQQWLLEGKERKRNKVRVCGVVRDKNTLSAQNKMERGICG